MNVYRHYQDILDKFTICAKASAFNMSIATVRLKKLRPPDSEWQVMDLADGHIALTADISTGNDNGFAENLNIELGSMEILIYPREQIRISAPWTIKRSQVEVAYIYHDFEAEKAYLLLALHFDFSVDDTTLEPAVAHPIFHVSLTDKPIMLRGVLQRKRVVLDRMSGIPDLRLPTAHMTLPSVLMNIAADRFLPDQFSIFLRSVRGAGLVYPKMENNPFTVRMRTHDSRMRSCAWYADLPAVS